MKSCWSRTTGGKLGFEFRDVPVPQPGPGEIVVRVRASALNRGALIVGGVVHGGEGERPAGNEAAGEVHAVGKDVSAFRPGDRVMGRARGALAEYVAMHAELAMPAPPHLSWEQAAGVTVVFLTAYELLHGGGRLAGGEWLLVTGASSGVGVACIQTAKLMGAQVMGTSGSARKLEKLRSIGLDVGIATRGADFAAKVMEVTGGHGADLAVNCVGGSVLQECMRALAFQGRLGIVGYVDGVLRNEIDLELLHANRLVLFGVSNSRVTIGQRIARMRGFARDVLPALADGRIVPLVDRVFGFDEIFAARDYVESNAQIGKVVVRVA